MAATRRTDTEEYKAATALAREIRETVAEQIAALIRDADQTGSGEKVQQRIERIVEIRREILEARARYERNREMGLPLRDALADEREGLMNLRSAVAMLSATAAEWCAAMDFAGRRRELELTRPRNGGGRRRDETDDI